MTQAVEPGEALTANVTLVNHAGLHFGPAVLFVQTAAKSEPTSPCAIYHGRRTCRRQAIQPGAQPGR